MRKGDTMEKNQTMTDEQLARELQNGKRGGGRGKLLTVIGCAATAIGIFTSVTAPPEKRSLSPSCRRS